MKLKQKFFMKHLSILLLLLLVACTAKQQSTFQFKGEYPTAQFVITQLNESGNELEFIDVNTIDARNRVYLIIDSLGNFRLNGHSVDLNDFQSDLTYILDNPDGLNHLPEGRSKAVICIDYGKLVPEDTIPALRFQIRAINNVLNNVVMTPALNYVKKELKKEMNELSQEELNMLDQKFSPKMAFVQDNSPFRPPTLPPDGAPIPEKSLERNVLPILVKTQDTILMNEAPIQLNQIKEQVKTFIMNPEQRPDLAEDSKKAIVSLKNIRGTEYELYFAVYNEIKAAYTELWEEKAQEQYGKRFDELDSKEQRQLKRAIPMVISEAEPTSFGN